MDIADLTKDTQTVYQCNSACMLIMSRGKNRVACSYANFKAHGSYNTNSKQPSPEGNQRMLDFYKEDPRVNWEFLESIFTNYPLPTTFYKLNATEAKEIGLVDEIINCNPVFAGI